jgi:uncharacterized protein (DUF58 family)
MAKSPYKFFEPDIVGRLSNLNIVARQAVEGFISGLHRSPHHGFSVEFSEHREYTAGDDVRHLDWVAYARTDRYYIKQYEQETNLRCTLLLDASGSMNYRYEKGPTKFEYACFLAACLAYLMARQQDLVGMIAFDEAVRFHLPPGSTPAHLDRLFTQLEALAPGKPTAIAATFHELAERIAKRGLIVIISDLYDDQTAVLKALQHFTYKKHQIILIHVLDPAELDLPFKRMQNFVDLETGEKMQVDPAAIRDAYRQEVADFISRYRRECGDRNIEYVLTTTATPYDRMLLNYLAKRRSARR